MCLCVLCVYVIKYDGFLLCETSKESAYTLLPFMLLVAYIVALAIEWLMNMERAHHEIA